MKVAYLIIAHGSRDSEANQAFFNFLEEFRCRFPDRTVRGAFLELAKPSIPEEIEGCVGEGIEQILILPLMFFPGRHVKDDIPHLIEEAKMKYPAVDFHYSSPLSDHPLMLQLIEEKAKALKNE